MENWANEIENYLKSYTPGGQTKFKQLTKIMTQRIPWNVSNLEPQFQEVGISTNKEKFKWKWKIYFSLVCHYSSQTFPEYFQLKSNYSEMYSRVKEHSISSPTLLSGRTISHGSDFSNPGSREETTSGGDETIQDTPLIAGFRAATVAGLYHGRSIKHWADLVLHYVPSLITFFTFFRDEEAYKNQDNDTTIGLDIIFGRLTIPQLLEMHHVIFGEFFIGAYAEDYKITIFIWLYKIVNPWIPSKVLYTLWFHLEYDSIPINGQFVDLSQPVITQCLNQILKSMQKNSMGLYSIKRHSFVQK